MRRIGMVRKRDGRLVPFDARKIADAIYKAALSVGGEDRFLAEELSDVVTVFLEKNPDLAVPSIEQIQDMVEKVLIETGHARTAKAFILYREERARVRRVRASRETADPEGSSTGPLIQDDLRETVEPWRREVLVAALEAESDLPADIAEEIAAQVDSLVISSGATRVSASLVAALADAELFRRGLLGGAGGVSGLPRERIRDLLLPKEGRGVTRPVEAAGRILLRSYALAEIHSSAVAAAHVEGRIHIHGLEAPVGLAGASVNPDALKGRGRARAGIGPAAEAAALGRELARTARAVEGRFAADDVNVALSPLVRDLSDERVREVVALFLESLDGRVEINLDSEVPTLLAIQPVRAMTGAALPMCYGELAIEARRILDAALDLWMSGEHADVPSLTVHLGPRAMTEPDFVDHACAASLLGRPITFVRMRDGMSATGSSVMRRLEPLDQDDARARRGFAFGKVSIHLPTAAARATPGCPTSFLTECAESMDLALRALFERRQILRSAGATPGTPLEPLLRRDGGGLFDLSRAAGIIGLAGLNEAVESCFGRELHEEDEALKLGERAASFCRLQAQEEAREADHEILVSESFEPEALDRLRRDAPRLTPGARMRRGAPIDLVTRIEREGRFHPVLRSATVSALFTPDEAVPPASAAALVRKTFQNTATEGLRLGREAG